MGPLERQSGSVVVVEVSPENVTFTRGANSISVRPVVYLAPEGKRQISVLGVGEKPSASGEVWEIAVFEPGGLEHAHRKVLCLQLLFQSGLTRLKEKEGFYSRFIRPKVKLKGIESLSPLLHGYEMRLVADALRVAGAREVVLEDLNVYPKP